MTGILRRRPGHSPSLVHNLFATFRSCNVMLYLNIYRSCNVILYLNIYRSCNVMLYLNIYRSCNVMLYLDLYIPKLLVGYTSVTVLQALFQSAQHLSEQREHMTNGSGSGRPKNMRILRIQIRIPNTDSPDTEHCNCPACWIARYPTGMNDPWDISSRGACPRNASSKEGIIYEIHRPSSVAEPEP